MDTAEKAAWLRSIEAAANSIKAGTCDPAGELDVFTRAVARINEMLSVLAIVGGGPREPEFDRWIDSTVGELRVVVPLVRSIYDARKEQWFACADVLKHGYCHARTWHDIVLRNAEEFVAGARLIHARHACRLLHDSGYESGKVQCHLEMEVEQASKGLRAASNKSQAAPWTPAAESEARRLIDSKAVQTASALQERLAMNRAVAQSLYRHITGKKKKVHRTD